MIIFSHCHHKNIWFTTSVVITLICLSLPTFNYLSSYTNTISKRIILQALLNQEFSDDKQIHVKEDPCTGRYIYMHDLPTKFNHDLVTNCHTLSQWFDFCPYLQNGGFGPRLNKKRWYDTNQFMLSVIFHNRMKNYECLTSSSVIASATYAPYYPGLDIGRYLWGGFNSSVKDATALDFATWLRGKPEWDRMLGGDHFFVAGRISWDFRRSSNSNTSQSMSWGSKLLNLPETKNMTILTIESNPYENNDIAIPYPTYFHPYTDTEVLQWQERVRSGTKRSRKRRRRYLFAFGGAPRPNMTGSVREELIRQCKTAVKNSCLLVNCWGKDDICNSPRNMINLYVKSDFCLQPPGDSYTRRSTFDSILAGCIPVFFHPGSAYVQYLWHFPKNYTKYSVFIPIDGVKNGSVNVGELLSKFSDTDVSAMREEVIKLIPRVIYAHNKLETIEDAFDVAVKRVLDRINEARRKAKEGKEFSSRNSYFTEEDGMQEWESFF